MPFLLLAMVLPVMVMLLEIYRKMPASVLCVMVLSPIRVSLAPFRYIPEVQLVIRLLWIVFPLE